MAKSIPFIYLFIIMHRLNQKKDGELIVTLNGCDLYVRDLRTLCGRSWLNDKVPLSVA